MTADAAVVAARFAQAMALADMLAERAEAARADGYGVLAGHLRADAAAIRADAWRDAGYA
jgi:hypothetical protein